MKDDSAYLRLMLDAFDKLCAFTAGMDEAAFLLDQKTQSAVIMQAAHDYFSLELPLVWETAMMEAPKAEKIIRDYVEQTFPPFPGTTP